MVIGKSFWLNMSVHLYTLVVDFFCNIYVKTMESLQAIFFLFNDAF